MLFRSNYLTYTCLHNNLIGYDLGKNNESTINRIVFCPRNDANMIIPGNKYELFYFDKKWISLGVKVANTYQLSYDNVPKKSLLWLRCLTEGKEERIFTYENGKQIWW